MSIQYDTPEFKARLSEDQPEARALSTQEIRNIFREADPTNNKKYVKWLVRGYLSGANVFLEDVASKGDSILRKFISLTDRHILPLKNRDINRYKGLNDLYEVLREYPDIVSSKDIHKAGEDNITHVYEDDVISIIIPLTKEAAIFHGRGTNWCTSANSKDNMFEVYSKKGPLYIITDKKYGYKMQFHFESGSFMNQSDKPIDWEDVEPNRVWESLQTFLDSLHLDVKTKSKLLVVTADGKLSTKIITDGTSLHPLALYAITGTMEWSELIVEEFFDIVEQAGVTYGREAAAKIFTISYNEAVREFQAGRFQWLLDAPEKPALLDITTVAELSDEFFNVAPASLLENQEEVVPLLVKHLKQLKKYASDILFGNTFAVWWILNNSPTYQEYEENRTAASAKVLVFAKELTSTFPSYAAEIRKALHPIAHLLSETMK